MKNYFPEKEIFGHDKHIGLLIFSVNLIFGGCHVGKTDRFSLKGDWIFDWRIFGIPATPMGIFVFEG